MRVTQVNHDTMVYKLEMWPVLFATTIGNIQMEINVTTTTLGECLTSWTISYPSDLCPRVLGLLEAKREATLKDWICACPSKL